MGLKLNLSADSIKETRFGDLPAGKYNVRISGCELKESKSEKNPGKPYYNIEFTVMDGKYEGSRDYTNACLWEGAHFSFVALLRALGQQVEAGDGQSSVELDVPDQEWFLDKELVIIKRIPKGKSDPEVRDFRPAQSETEVSTSNAGRLLL